MALYVITDGANDNESIVLDGLDAVKEQIREWFEDGTYAFRDGDGPYVYQLGKKMTVEVETKVTIKGE